ncbi:hypothetical protein LTR09_002772 [Extremus antarcticus]|uniref:DUF7702 domain-containing protein n=1 Tax=Extremus antarcticus TaxID=702011 RepID=A0AAJ0GF08_9PEZI|nr:hypothetical protein LTR09_002772 [Extremus antarcticus]
MNPHTSLGIAQVVFWAPIVPLAICLMYRNWRYRPRMAWWPMVPLSLMRVAGGGCIIAVESRESFNLGLVIATIVLLNVGAIPLIVNELGFVRAILQDNFSDRPMFHRIVKGIQLSFIPAVALLSTGGGLISSSPTLGRTLALVGYVVFAVILCVLVAMKLYFLTLRSTLLPSSRKAGRPISPSQGRIFTGGLAAAPFLIVRNLYGILEYTKKNWATSEWSPVFGSAVTFAFMALLMEYVAICMWLYVGYTIPPDRGARSAGQRDVETK